jgi:hypothetical protein
MQHRARNALQGRVHVFVDEEIVAGEPQVVHGASSVEEAIVAGLRHSRLPPCRDRRTLDFRANTHAFIEGGLIPIIEQFDRDGRSPRELVWPMGKLSFYGATLDGYGRAG